jgi:transcriptional regulator with XRE-family HTH domain
VAGLGEDEREKVSLFVEELRAMRTQRGWTQAELARETNYSESAVAMVETYQRAPTLQLAKSLDRALGTPGFTDDGSDAPGTPGTFMRLWQRLRTISFPASFRSFAEHEDTATELRTFQHSLVPGLLQTEGYARATLVRQPTITDERVSELLAIRMVRQSMLNRKSPLAPLMWVLLDEGLLYREVGSSEVMGEQVMKLVAASELPNVTIQILPMTAGGHRGLEGAFVIADFTGLPSIVFLDDLLGGRVTENAEEVAESTLHFSTLRSEAFPRAASRELMLKAAKEKWTV